MTALIVIAMAASVVVLDSQAPTSRFVVIASDLHLGAGRNANGEWLPSEDFRWQADLASFGEVLNQPTPPADPASE